MLEWLVYSLPEEQLRDPRVVKSVEFIATLLDDQPNADWSVGPLGHALHALAIYDKRISRAAPSETPASVARREPIHAAMVPQPEARHGDTWTMPRAIRPARSALSAAAPGTTTRRPESASGVGPILFPAR